ncbi:MAG: DUF202 domain-containing protein [Mycobacterium sp.]
MTGPDPATPADAGLQAERTVMSWTRTSLAVLVNGFLLLFKSGFPTNTGPIRLGLVCFAAASALTIYLVGVRRQRTLKRRPLPRPVTARRQIYVSAGLVVVLIVATTLALAPWQ